MWAPWCAFVSRHHDAEQAEIARAARELAGDLLKRLRAQLPGEVWDTPAGPTSPPQTLRTIDTTNVVPFRTGDIALDSVNRYYLEQGKWWFPVAPVDDQ